MVDSGTLRKLKGHRVTLQLTQAGGGERLTGEISNCLESADGLVVYLAEDGGRVRGIHYQHIAELSEPA